MSDLEGNGGVPVVGEVDLPPGGRFAAAQALHAATAAYATGRRDTPTGTVIARLDPQADRETWLHVRRTGIGSSDMAAVLGMSRYRSELDVWADKVGDVDLDNDAAGEAARWGNLLEDIVAREWAERQNSRTAALLPPLTVRRVGTIANVDRRHMLCDLDRLVVGCPDHARCALEVKTRSAWKADEWKDGAIPDDVEAQVMQQLAVTGLDAIHVAALVGGQRLESRLVLPDADYIADLHAVADSFWTNHVLTGAPPAISSLDLLVEHLSRLAPPKGVEADLDDVEQRELVHLSHIAAEAARTETAGKEATAKIKALIGEDATDVVIDGVTWWTWRPQNAARKLDRDKIAADLGVEPGDLLALYGVSEGTQRTLRKGPAVKALIEGDG